MIHNALQSVLQFCYNWAVQSLSSRWVVHVFKSDIIRKYYMPYWLHFMGFFGVFIIFTPFLFWLYYSTHPTASHRVIQGPQPVQAIRTEWKPCCVTVNCFSITLSIFINSSTGSSTLKICQSQLVLQTSDACTHAIKIKWAIKHYFNLYILKVLSFRYKRNIKVRFW